MATVRARNSGDSYSRAVTVYVTAMLPPTMRAIAIQNNMKIRRNRLCMSPGERIARPTDVLDLGILAGFQIELAAQIADVGIDAAVVGDELAAEGLLGHRLTRDHLPRGAHEQFEHAEFRAGERHRLIRDVYQMRSGMQGDRPDGEFVGHAAARRADAGPAQDRTNARHQLTRIEGLAQVVAGAEFQANDPVDIVAARREHQDRRLVGRSQFAQHVEAADARQHHVENQNFELAGLQYFQGVAAVVHALDLEVLGVQVFGEHLTKFAVVVDQQNPRLARLAVIRLRWVGERHSYPYFGTVDGLPWGRSGNLQFLTDRCLISDTCL